MENPPLEEHFYPAQPDLPSRDLPSRDLPPRNRRLPRLLWILAVLCVMLVLPQLVEKLQYGWTRGQLRAKADQATEELARLGKDAELATLSDTSKAFRLVARRIEPSVVHIDTVQEVQFGRNASSDEWGFQLPPNRRRFEAQGQGSGVVVDAENGYVLTNNHVVQSAVRVQVNLSDGRTIKSDEIDIVGVDVLTDLAVLRLHTNNLIAATWGNSQELEVGDWVLAVGNPYGLDRTVTCGIVSATQRRGLGHGVYQSFLQTDAAVNPGNSGGPLLNIRGELIGITTAIVGEAYQGISFAIPSEVARDVYNKLKEHGHVARGWLGVQMAEMDEEVARQLNLGGQKGAFVGGVLPGSPAEAAGVQPGDLVIEWNGQKVSTNTELPLMVASTQVGSTAKVKVLREGKPLELSVKITERPQNLPARR
ncbi:MAG TPA: trypsin-like peptidase domain-containing protein [Pirellulales bacterium]|nr:trypsin-like peptidase domain-containing protein [Pirellulales bacterium]